MRAKIFLMGSTKIENYSRAMIDRMPEAESSLYKASILSFPLFARPDFNNYDIVHNLVCYPILPPEKRRARIITTAHEFQILTYPQLNRLWQKSVKDKLYALGVLAGLYTMRKYSDAIAVNSIQTRNEALDLGYQKQDVFYTPLGVGQEYMSGKKQKKDTKMFTIGTIGTLSERKNTKFIIEAFRQAQIKGKRLELWGNSLYRKEDLLKPSDKEIRLRGYLPSSRMVVTYDSFDVFMFPSLYEGFGLPILEAKVRGLPVIIYKQGHISPEIKKYCFEATDYLEAAEILEDLARNGYDEGRRVKAMKDARMYTWDNTARLTKEMYNEVLER